MPYTVCVNQPGCLPESSPAAYATLEEARWAMAEEIARSDEGNTAFTPYERSLADEAVGEDGGLYHLPDCYVIDVTYVEWSQLARMCDPPLPITGPAGREWTDEDKDEIIDAYNEGD